MVSSSTNQAAELILIHGSVLRENRTDSKKSEQQSEHRQRNFVAISLFKPISSHVSIAYQQVVAWSWGPFRLNSRLSSQFEVSLLHALNFIKRLNLAQEKAFTQCFEYPGNFYVRRIEASDCLDIPFQVSVLWQC